MELLKNKITLFLLVIGAFATGFAGCANDVNLHPDPGVVRVVLQSAPQDTSIVLVKDTLPVGDSDVMMANVFQGKIYDGEKYFILYKNLNTTNQEDETYNLLKRDNGEYFPHIIFETQLPEATYDTLEFGLTASYLRLGTNRVDIVMPEGEEILMRLGREIRISENDTTEVTVQVKPLESVQRRRNTMVFNRQVEITDIAVK